MALTVEKWKYFFDRCDSIIGEKMINKLNELFTNDIFVLSSEGVRQLLEKLNFDDFESELLYGSYTVDEVIQYKKELDDELDKLIWLTYFFN